MRKSVLILWACAMFSFLAGSALANDAELCLDCHEPAEDWQGMTPEAILAEARDTDIKRHADNAEFTEEQLKAMIAQLLQQ